MNTGAFKDIVIKAAANAAHLRVPGLATGTSLPPWGKFSTYSLSWVVASTSTSASSLPLSGSGHRPHRSKGGVHHLWVEQEPHEVQKRASREEDARFSGRQSGSRRR